MWNQLNGSKFNVHAEHLREATVSDWNTPPPPQKKNASDKPMRTACLAVEPTHSSSDSEVEVSPTSRLTRHYKRERDGSSEEDDLPMAELRRREQARAERPIHEAESAVGEGGGGGDGVGGRGGNNVNVKTLLITTGKCVVTVQQIRQNCELI